MVHVLVYVVILPSCTVMNIFTLKDLSSQNIQILHKLLYQTCSLQLIFSVIAEQADLVAFSIAFGKQVCTCATNDTQDSFMMIYLPTCNTTAQYCNRIH